MHMLTRRLQILLDEERHGRLVEEAERRQVPVAVVVRDALDAAYPVSDAKRRAAFARIMAAPQMNLPDPEGLRAELDEIRAGLA